MCATRSLFGACAHGGGSRPLRFNFCQSSDQRKRSSRTGGDLSAGAGKPVLLLFPRRLGIAQFSGFWLRKCHDSFDFVFPVEYPDWNPSPQL